jgi:hypothetical protein
MINPVARLNPLDQALRYLSLGLSVIPIKARDKKPAIGSWKIYQSRHATPEELSKWFSGHDDLNIAIVTGGVSRVIVIDGDSPEAVSWINANHPTPIRTVTSAGRKHFFYLHPGHEVRNGAKLAGMALDVRGDGGYVVAPGSVHSSGAVYEAEGDWSQIDALPVFQAAWLGEKIQPLINPVDAIEKRVRAYLSATPGAIQGSAGDVHTFRVACKLVREFALPEDQALAYLGDWNAKCSPPWSMIDLKKKIQSAIKSGTAPIGSKLDAPSAGSWRPPVGGAPPKSVDVGGAGNLDELLHRNDKDKIQKSAGNLAKILRMHQQWRGRLALDEMTRDVLYDGVAVGDEFIDFVQEEIENKWHLQFGREEVAAKLVAAASVNKIHPVREMLRALPTWDGTERIPRMGLEILGNDAPLVTQYLLRTMVGAIRRVFEPGTKMDTVLVLVGPQGSLKSTFFKTLFGSRWFSDSPLDLDSKDGMLLIHRRWCTELPEIDHMTSSKAAERVKAFTSSSEDIFRPPYGRATVVWPRSCVLVGTANRDGFLVDPTGSRRFWPVQVHQLDLDMLVHRDQLWAEAMLAYGAGVEHWLSAGLDALREAESPKYEADDPWTAQTSDAIDTLVRAGRSLSDGVTIAELLSLMGVPVAQQTRNSSMRMAEILKTYGMRKKKIEIAGDRRMRWIQ